MRFIISFKSFKRNVISILKIKNSLKINTFILPVQTRGKRVKKNVLTAPNGDKTFGQESVGVIIYKFFFIIHINAISELLFLFRTIKMDSSKVKVKIYDL